MKTLYLTTRFWRRVFIGSLSILAALALALPSPRLGAAQEQPSFRANPHSDWVDAWFWPLGAELHLTIEDPNTTLSPDFEMSQTVTVVTEPPDYQTTSFQFAGLYDLKTGDELTLTDGVTTKHLVIPVLSVTSVDMQADTVGGFADPGATVHVFSGPDIQLFLTADASGFWLADFSGLLNLVPGTSIGVEVWDADGDSTIIDWSIPPSHLVAFPEEDAVEAWEWPDGALVHLSIDDPSTAVSPDYADNGTMAVTTWGDARAYHRFEFAGAYDLKPGDVVTVTDGTTPRTHTVLSLSVTGVNATADTVTGKADPGAQVQVWPHGYDQIATVQPITGEDGNWLAAFSGRFDIVAGTGGRAQILDKAGSSTAVDWNAPAPSFTAFPADDVIEGWGWPLGATLYLTIDDPATEPSPDFHKEGTVVPAPWGTPYPWVWIEFSGEYDLKVGDVVKLTDGVTPQTHVVQNLMITDANAVDNTVMGSADPGTSVDLWSWEDPEGRRLQVTADASGAWAADFDDVGFDLLPDYHVVAEVWDESGNDTAMTWTVSAPPPPPTPITQGMHVRLPADAGWVDSGVVVAAGVPTNITASGRVLVQLPRYDRDAHSGPDGMDIVCSGSCALDGAPYGALIGRIGLYGEPFVIGSGYLLDSSSGGVLYLAVNDNDIYYADNSGNYIVLFGQ